jgi:serine/threonine protein kinase
MTEVDIARLEEGEDLAAGRYGLVRRMTNSRRREDFAVKFYNPIRFAGDIDAVVNQMNTFLCLCHPCVLPIRRYTPPRDGSGLILATDYLAKGSLEEVLQNPGQHSGPGGWTHTRIAIAAAGIALGMNYLHTWGVTHGTLKPADILLDDKYRAKISDYQTSTLERLRAVKSSQVGSPSYLAPEVYEDGVVPTGKVDVFAFGLILYEMVVGVKAFPTSLSTASVMKRVLLGQRPKIPANVPEWVRILIERCWTVKSQTRPTFTEIVEKMNANKYTLFDDVDSEQVREFMMEMENG